MHKLTEVLRTFSEFELEWLSSHGRCKYPWTRTQFELIVCV
jgi:hypothetical protein